MDLFIDGQIQNGPLPEMEARLTDTIQKLLSHGADAALSDEDGETPADLVRKYGDSPLLRRALSALGEDW